MTLENKHPNPTHIRSREEVIAIEAMNKPQSIIDFEASLVEHLGGDEKSAHYEDYPIDYAIKSTKVERTGGVIEGGWFILGQAENNDGEIIYKVGRNDDEGRPLTKPATPEQLAAWNTPETQSSQAIKSDLGRIGLRLGGGEVQPLAQKEVIDAPVEQLDEMDDDGLTEQQSIEAAAVDPRSDDEKAQDAWNASAREADHKHNLARQTERIRDGGN